MENKVEVIRPTDFEVGVMFRKLLTEGDVLIESMNWAPEMDKRLLNESRNWVIHRLKSKFKGKKFSEPKVLVIDYNEELDELRALLMDETAHAAYSKEKDIERAEKESLRIANERLVLDDHMRNFRTIMDRFDVMFWYLMDLTSGRSLPWFDRQLHKVNNRKAIKLLDLVYDEGCTVLEMVEGMELMFGPDYKILSDCKTSKVELSLVNDKEDLFLTYGELLERVVVAYKRNLKQLWVYINSPMTEKFSPVYISHGVQVYFRLEFLYYRILNIKFKKGDFIYESI